MEREKVNARARERERVGERERRSRSRKRYGWWLRMRRKPERKLLNCSLSLVALQKLLCSR